MEAINKEGLEVARVANMTDEERVADLHEQISGVVVPPAEVKKTKAELAAEVPAPDWLETWIKNKPMENIIMEFVHFRLPGVMTWEELRRVAFQRHLEGKDPAKFMRGVVENLQKPTDPKITISPMAYYHQKLNEMAAKAKLSLKPPAVA